jgi:hypothetical protein
MPRTVKRLAQSALSTTATARYTAPAATTAQVTEIYLVNNGASDRAVDIYQGGTAATNRIMRGVSVPAGGCTILQDLKIVVAAGQTLAANQDAGTDIIMTAFGIEEV